MSISFSSESKLVFFAIASILVLITIPFPGYIFNSIAIILMAITWIFCNDFKEKRNLFKNNYKWILLLSIPFSLSVLGLLYTDNSANASQDLVDNLPFLIFPLFFLTVPLPQNYFSAALNMFSFAVSMSCLFAVSVGLYFRWMNMGNLFFYDKFSLILDKHTTYISLYIVLSILVLIFNLFKRKNLIILIPQILFQFAILYVLSVRISIVALSLAMIVLLFLSIKSKLKYSLVLLMPVFIYAIYSSPNFQKRFDLNPTEMGEISDFEYRKLHWKSVIETIQHNSMWIGTGTAGERGFLYEKYKEYKLPEAVQEQYNAHNQYLETILNYGIMGFIFFLVLIFFLTFQFIKKKNILGIPFLSVFLIYFMTESLLERQIGIVLFAFFMTFLIKMDKGYLNKIH